MLQRSSITILLLLAIASCGGADSRQKTLRGTLATLSSLRQEFHVEDRQRSIKIATTTPTPDVDKVLENYRKNRAHIIDGFVAAYAALAAAAVGTDDVKLAIEAAATVYRDYRLWKADVP